MRAEANRLMEELSGSEARAEEARQVAEDRIAAADAERQTAIDRATDADDSCRAAERDRCDAAAAFSAHAAALRANAAALGAANYAARAQSLAVATRGEATRETLATELEAALDDADALRDALRRRDPPLRPAADRRSVSAPVEAVASLEADLDALRRDVASLRPRQQASPPLWLFFAAVGLALTAWIMTPEDPYAAALAS